VKDLAVGLKEKDLALAFSLDLDAAFFSFSISLFSSFFVLSPIFDSLLMSSFDPLVVVLSPVLPLVTCSFSFFVSSFFPVTTFASTDDDWEVGGLLSFMSSFSLLFVERLVSLLFLLLLLSDAVPVVVVNDAGAVAAVGVESVEEEGCSCVIRPLRLLAAVSSAFATAAA